MLSIKYMYLEFKRIPFIKLALKFVTLISVIFMINVQFEFFRGYFEIKLGGICIFILCDIYKILKRQKIVTSYGLCKKLFFSFYK